MTARGAKVGVVGVPIRFEASSNRSSPRSSDYSWSLGDGSEAEGDKLDQVYQYPGEYIVVVRVEMRDEEAISRLNLKIVPDTLKISATDSNRIEVSNDGDFEVDLFGRELVVGGNHFAFPEYTIIKPNQKISFPASVTGLATNTGTIVALNIINSENKSHIETKEINREISLENQAKIGKLREQIASLQLKQMELRRAEESRVSENFASVSASQGNEISSTSTESDSISWVDTLKKFFGFK
ncbi:MAG: PKD domain-containing protein [Minisyncoccota bacterium]